MPVAPHGGFHAFEIEPDKSADAARWTRVLQLLISGSGVRASAGPLGKTPASAGVIVGNHGGARCRSRDLTALSDSNGHGWSWSLAKEKRLNLVRCARIEGMSRTLLIFA